MIRRPLVLLLLALPMALFAQNYPSIPTDPKPGDRMLAEYFKQQTREIADASLGEIQTADDWYSSRGRYREQLFEMLGIPSRLERTELKPQVTGSQTHQGVVIENLSFQSLPGLHVTANFYRPAKAAEKPLPAILYVCGHSGQKELGISFGNKTAYHHHGLWFAKNGYTCLMIDTIQLGEIEGIHHGTYRYGRWWWNSRGYTPAGVEAWNGIRALDYLQSRPEVDGKRIGMTGRSGGGAYTWWVAALDERVKVAVPVAGIASLHNHVVDGVVEGHCDCMYHNNTYRWDFAAVAALVAPRALMIANTDKDPIFPLDGVVDVHSKARRIYRLLGAEDMIGLSITEGPHKDTQPLRTVAFEWFERHLKSSKLGDEVDTRAPKGLDRRSMRAFDQLPPDEIVTTIDQSFVAVAPRPLIPADGAAWEKMRDGWQRDLRERVFRGWPQQEESKAPALNLEELGREKLGGVTLVNYEFDSQAGIRLPLLVAVPNRQKDPSQIELRVVGDEGVAWRTLIRRLRDEAVASKSAIALFAPRGIGPTAWTEDERERVQIRRRFMLLGQTLDGMRVWDIRRAIAALRESGQLEGKKLRLSNQDGQACNLLYASVFEKGISEIALSGLEPSHADADAKTAYLNVLRFLDVPAAVAMAAEQKKVIIRGAGDDDAWDFPMKLAEKFGWEGIRLKPEGAP